MNGVRTFPSPPPSAGERVSRKRGGQAKRIEWTGAGGDYFLGVVVDGEDQVIAEFWGTRREILNWMEAEWPTLPAKYAPMVYNPAARRGVLRTVEPPHKMKRAHA